jgi:DNA-binding transcriptional ArsR family regulator
MTSITKQRQLNKDTAARRADTLKALGHPIRLQIVDLLAAAPHNVGELADKLGVQSAIVSQQLKILRLSGLVAVNKRGGRSYYDLANSHLSNLLECLRSCDQA